MVCIMEPTIIFCGILSFLVIVVLILDNRSCSCSPAGCGCIVVFEWLVIVGGLGVANDDLLDLGG